MKSILTFLFIAVVAGIGGYAYTLKNPRLQPPTASPTPISSGNSATSPDNNLMRVTFPLNNDTVHSPLLITGEARGTWFFEGTFPVSLLDEKGTVLASGHATAQGEWMTENFVPFTAKLTFTKPISGTTGKVIVQKDNPSGLPENDQSVSIPVVFE